MIVFFFLEGGGALGMDLHEPVLVRPWCWWGGGLVFRELPDGYILQDIFRVVVILSPLERVHH